VCGAPWVYQEDKLRDKPGYEHLREPLHVIVEAELPADVCELQVHQACEILQELLKPVVSTRALPCQTLPSPSNHWVQQNNHCMP